MRRAICVVLSLAALAAGCARERAYELRGQVLAVDVPRQELTIKHGDIRGFMPGMTMPFKVRDARLLEGRAPGDLVTATLVVLDTGAYLSTVTATGRAPVTDAAPVRTFDLLEPGSAVPDLAVRDESGSARSLRGWRGRVLALTFTYTRCPLPDFCPRMDQAFLAAQRALLADAGLRDRAALVSISIDPEFDTPEVLSAHARRAGADPAVWHFVTGDRGAVEHFAGRFGVSVFHDGTAPSMLTHNLRTAVVKPDGTLAAVLSGSDWTPAALVEAMRRAGE